MSGGKQIRELQLRKSRHVAKNDLLAAATVGGELATKYSQAGNYSEALNELLEIQTWHREMSSGNTRHRLELAKVNRSEEEEERKSFVSIHVIIILHFISGNWETAIGIWSGPGRPSNVTTPIWR